MPKKEMMFTILAMFSAVRIDRSRLVYVQSLLVAKMKKRAFIS
jgi:hypothetical protein